MYRGVGHGEVALLIQVKKMVKVGLLLLRVILLDEVAPGQIMSWTQKLPDLMFVGGLSTASTVTTVL